jgi:protein tyrosine/serine phosphatase
MVGVLMEDEAKNADSWLMKNEQLVWPKGLFPSARLGGEQPPMTKGAEESRWDLSTKSGRFAAHLDFVVKDYAFFRVPYPNAHWIGSDLVRSSQPWPFQLRRWRDQGIKTIINLRGEEEGSHDLLERDACRKLGLTLIYFKLWSRAAPTREMIEGAKKLFETIQYPVLIHCKSGADRAGTMAVLYRHFQLGESVRDALRELHWTRGHAKAGLTGVLDYFFERYLAEGEPAGLSLLEWVRRPDYDPQAINEAFRAGFWGTVLTEKILRRE